MIFLIVGVVLGLGICVYGIVTVRQVDDTLAGRLTRYDLKPATNISDLQLQIPGTERIFGPIRRRAARTVREFTPAGTIEKTQVKLAQAGNPKNLTVQDFLGLKGMFAAGLGILAFLLLTFFVHLDFVKFIIALAVAVVVGFNLPNFWLAQLMKKRQKEIQKFLPDAIDILAISVAAGQGFDGALETLSKRKKNALTYEFDRFRLETQAGKARREALRDLAMRTGVEDVQGFVAAMIQADQLGIGIAQILRSQSEELRIKRRQRAEEKARQAPIKMLFPLVLLMFPSLFIVILGPAVPRLMLMGNA